MVSDVSVTFGAVATIACAVAFPPSNVAGPMSKSAAFGVSVQLCLPERQNVVPERCASMSAWPAVIGTPTHGRSTGGDARESGPVPEAFLAATVNVLVVPRANPVMVPDKEPEVNVRGSNAMPCMYGVTMYAVVAEPLFCAGALQCTVTLPWPNRARTPVGATGAPTVIEGLDRAGPVPSAFFAAT